MTATTPTPAAISATVASMIDAFEAQITALRALDREGFVLQFPNGLCLRVDNGRAVAVTPEAATRYPTRDALRQPDGYFPVFSNGHHEVAQMVPAGEAIDVTIKNVTDVIKHLHTLTNS